AAARPRCRARARVLLGLRHRLELGAVRGPRLEPARRLRGRVEPARGAALPGHLPQLQLPPRASPPPGRPLDPPAAPGEAGRSRALVLLDLLAALARRRPCPSPRRAGAASPHRLPAQRGAPMTARPISWPTWGRLATGMGGAVRVAIVFFPVYLGGAAGPAARPGHGHPS